MAKQGYQNTDRQAYQYVGMTDYRGGVCLDEGRAQANQLLIAQNVWSPKGELQTRPGFTPVRNLFGDLTPGTSSGLAGSAMESGGSYSYPATSKDIELNTASRADNFTYYLGVSGNDILSFDTIGLQFNSLNGNINTAHVNQIVSYWSTSGAWKPLPVEIRLSGVITLDGHEERRIQGTVGQTFGTVDSTDFTPSTSTNEIAWVFKAPADWATVESWADRPPNATEFPTNAYGLKLQLIPGEDSTLEPTPSGDLEFRLTNTSDIVGTLLGVVSFQGASGQRAWSLYGYSTQGLTAGEEGSFDVRLFAGRPSLLGGTDGLYRIGLEPHWTATNPGPDQTTTIYKPVNSSELPSTCPVPLSDELFVAYDHTITRHTTEGIVELAQVETAQDIVGIFPSPTGGPDIRAPYNSQYVSSYNQFPTAKYLLLHNDRIFAANMADSGYIIQWSAPWPAHKVWPTTNFAALMEADNSPITGLSSFGEQAVVFKQDSIWVLQSSGLNDIGEEVFVPTRVCEGVGCVANSSIQKTPFGLMFLSEDGVYLFNGAPIPTKISENIDLLFQRMNYGRRQKCTSAIWRTENCYLLSLALDDSTENTTTLVYNWKDRAWWVWDGFAPVQWVTEEDGADNERLCFIDSKSFLNELGADDDCGAPIDVDILTPRLRYGLATTATARELRISTDSGAKQFYVELRADDAPEAESVNGQMLAHLPEASFWGEISTDGLWDGLRELTTETAEVSTQESILPRQFHEDRDLRLYTEDPGEFTDGTADNNDSLFSAFIQVDGYSTVDQESTTRSTVGSGIGSSTTLFPKMYWRGYNQNFQSGHGLNYFGPFATVGLSALSGSSLDASWALGYGPSPASAKWQGSRRRELRWTPRLNGRWFQIRIRANSPGQKLILGPMRIGFVTQGHR